MNKYETMKQARELSDRADRYYRICMNCLETAMAARYHVNGIKGKWPISGTVDRAAALYNRYSGKARICWKYYIHCYSEWYDSLKFY